MMTSILTTIKQLLSIPDEITIFDTEIIVGINSALMYLNQLGVGSDGGFLIKGYLETWEDLLGSVINLEAVKTFVYLKTKLTFDPPQTAHLIEAINRQITELEWRIAVQKEESEEAIL